MSESKGLNDRLAGQVEWRFRCDRGPCADDVTASESLQCMPLPWWDPGSRRKEKGKGRAKYEDDEEADTDTKSSVPYRIS